jgi:uracil-DNA glycosylase family 4
MENEDPRLTCTVETSRNKIIRLTGTWEQCIQCSFAQARHNVVQVRGHLPAEFCFVGEAPGKTEDLLGWPFSGRSGHLLFDWVREAGGDGLRVAYVNLLACRPCDYPGGPNRVPTRKEIMACSSRLDGVLKVVKPLAYILLGKTVADNWSPGPQKLATLELQHPARTLRLGAEGEGESKRTIVALRAFFRTVQRSSRWQQRFPE